MQCIATSAGGSGIRGLSAKTAAVAMLTLAFASSASALPTLQDFGINIDNTTSCDFGPCDTDGLADLSGVAGVNDGGFDYATGLGSVFVTVTGAGAHNVDFFLDHDFLGPGNGFDNEDVVTGGALAAGQSWEVDEPGFGTFPKNGSAGFEYFGDIFDNFLGSSFDGQVFFDAIDGQSLAPPDNVSMGLGFDFNLLAGQTANLVFTTAQSAPGSGFFIEHFDPDSNESVFFSATLQVPEPGMLWLMSAGLLAIASRGRRRVLGKD